MQHGYTNATERVGSSVVKTYAGPRAAQRAQVERRALKHLSGQVPVPAVVGGDAGILIAEFVPGRHGQDLVDDGFAREVLAGCGHVLRSLHSINPATVFGGSGEDGVIVHGDFGPNNVLFADDGFAVAAVLDWEFCHVGDRLEDLAWCEWIIRAHHRDAVPELPSLFGGYGWAPPWEERRACMVRRCESLEQFCREWDPDGHGVTTWAERGNQAAGWQE